MKQKLFIILLGILFMPFNVSGWTLLNDVLPASFASYNKLENKYTNVQDVSSGGWHIYYNNSNWYQDHLAHPNGTGSIFMGAHYKKDTGTFSSQIGTKFSLNKESIQDASKVRFSFNITFLEGGTLTGGWTEIPVDVELGRQRAFNLNSSWSGFYFGLMHLATETYIPATILYNGIELVTLQDYSSYVQFEANQNSMFNVQFDINSDILQHNDQEYSFLLNTEVRGIDGWLFLGEDLSSFFSISDMKLEKLIPESSSALFAFMSIGALAFRRKK